MKYKTILFILITLLVASCGEDEIKISKFNHNVEFDMDCFKNLQTITESNSAHSGNKICHLDSGQNYGFVYSLNIPDSIIGKNLSVTVDAWVRTGNKTNLCGLVCSITNIKDSILSWQIIDANKFISTENEWSNINETIIFNNTLISDNCKINIMSYNISAKSYYDLDDLTIQYSELEN